MGHAHLSGGVITYRRPVLHGRIRPQPHQAVNLRRRNIIRLSDAHPAAGPVIRLKPGVNVKMAIIRLVIPGAIIIKPSVAGLAALGNMVFAGDNDAAHPGPVNAVLSGGREPRVPVLARQHTPFAPIPRGIHIRAVSVLPGGGNLRIVPLLRLHIPDHPRSNSGKPGTLAGISRHLIAGIAPANPPRIRHRIRNDSGRNMPFHLRQPGIQRIQLAQGILCLLHGIFRILPHLFHLVQSLLGLPGGIRRVLGRLLGNGTPAPPQFQRGNHLIRQPCEKRSLRGLFGGICQGSRMFGRNRRHRPVQHPLHLTRTIRRIKLILELIRSQLWNRQIQGPLFRPMLHGQIHHGSRHPFRGPAHKRGPA